MFKVRAACSQGRVHFVPFPRPPSRHPSARVYMAALLLDVPDVAAMRRRSYRRGGSRRGRTPRTQAASLQATASAPATADPQQLLGCLHQRGQLLPLQPWRPLLAGGTIHRASTPPAPGPAWAPHLISMPQHLRLDASPRALNRCLLLSSSHPAGASRWQLPCPARRLASSTSLHRLHVAPSRPTEPPLMRPACCSALL